MFVNVPWVDGQHHFMLAFHVPLHLGDQTPKWHSWTKELVKTGHLLKRRESDEHPLLYSSGCVTL